MADTQAAKRRRGRPPKSGGGAIIGIGKGIRLTWTDGHWRGTPLLEVKANALSDAGVTLPLHDGNWDVLAFVQVDRFDPTSAVAVIQSLIGEGVQVIGDVPVGEILRLRGLDVDPDDFPEGF